MTQQKTTEGYCVIWLDKDGNQAGQVMGQAGWHEYLSDHPHAHLYRVWIDDTIHNAATIDDRLRGLEYEQAARMIYRLIIPMRDLYRLASMHQRAHKHGQLRPMSKARFIQLAGYRGALAWQTAQASIYERSKRFYGWTNYFTHEAWIRAHHPDWPF